MNFLGSVVSSPHPPIADIPMNSLWQGRVVVLSTVLWAGSIVIIAFIVKRAFSSQGKPPDPKPLQDRKVEPKPPGTPKSSQSQQGPSSVTVNIQNNVGGPSLPQPSNQDPSDSQSMIRHLFDEENNGFIREHTLEQPPSGTANAATSMTNFGATTSTGAQTESPSTNLSTAEQSITDFSALSPLSTSEAAEGAQEETHLTPPSSSIEEYTSSANDTSLNTWTNHALGNFIDNIHPQADDSISDTSEANPQKQPEPNETNDKQDANSTILKDTPTLSSSKPKKPSSTLTKNNLSSDDESNDCLDQEMQENFRQTIHPQTVDSDSDISDISQTPTALEATIPLIDTPLPTPIQTQQSQEPSPSISDEETGHDIPTSPLDFSIPSTPLPQQITIKVTETNDADTAVDVQTSEPISPAHTTTTQHLSTNVETDTEDTHETAQTTLTQNVSLTNSLSEISEEEQVNQQAGAAATTEPITPDHNAQQLPETPNTHAIDQAGQEAETDEPAPPPIPLQPQTVTTQTDDEKIDQPTTPPAAADNRSASPTPSTDTIGVQPLTPVKGKAKKVASKVDNYSSISVGHFDFENPFQQTTDDRDLTFFHAQFPHDLKVYMRGSEKDSDSITFSDELASKLNHFGWEKKDQNQILSLLLQRNLYAHLLEKALASDEAKQQLPKEITDSPPPIFDATKKPKGFIHSKAYSKPTKIKLMNLFFEKSNYLLQCMFCFTEKLHSSSSFVLWKNVKHPLRSFDLPSVINELHSPKGFCSVIAKEHTFDLSLDNAARTDSDTFKANKKYCKTNPSHLSKNGWQDFTIPHIHRLLSAEALWEKLKKPILASLVSFKELNQLELNQACFSKEQKTPGIYLNDFAKKQIVIKNVFFQMGSILIQGCFLLKILESSTAEKTNFQVSSWYTVWIKGSDPLHALSSFSTGSTANLLEM